MAAFQLIGVDDAVGSCGALAGDGLVAGDDYLVEGVVTGHRNIVVEVFLSCLEGYGGGIHADIITAELTGGDGDAEVEVAVAVGHGLQVGAFDSHGSARQRLTFVVADIA